jgi:hypothetical protein
MNRLREALAAIRRFPGAVQILASGGHTIRLLSTSDERIAEAEATVSGSYEDAAGLIWSNWTAVLDVSKVESGTVADRIELRMADGIFVFRHPLPSPITLDPKSKTVTIADWPVSISKA